MIQKAIDEAANARGVNAVVLGVLQMEGSFQKLGQQYPHMDPHVERAQQYQQAFSAIGVSEPTSRALVQQLMAV